MADVFFLTVQLNRSLPWRQPTNERRKAEQVRPIFWANRPKSYINRTSDWDKYPQGRYVISNLHCIAFSHDHTQAQSDALPLIEVSIT